MCMPLPRSARIPLAVAFRASVQTGGPRTPALARLELLLIGLLVRGLAVCLALSNLRRGARPPPRATQRARVKNYSRARLARRLMNAISKIPLNSTPIFICISLSIVCTWKSDLKHCFRGQSCSFLFKKSEKHRFTASKVPLLFYYYYFYFLIYNVIWWM